MARIRTIKPEFWRNESLAAISAEACLLAVGLLNHCDDDGYFNFNPKLVQSDIFPLRELYNTITVLLRELSDIGYITTFQGSDGKVYGLIPNFVRHQVINKKNPSKIKGLCELPYNYGSDTVVLPTGKEGNGNGNGKEIKEGKPSLSSAGLMACPQDQILKLWAKHLPHLAQPRIWEGTRRATTKQRWNQASRPSQYSPDGYETEADGIKWWDSFFGYIANNTSLANGFESDGRTWRPDLEWILNARNFQRIIDGKYTK